jgi:hypothetical protein
MQFLNRLPSVHSSSVESMRRAIPICAGGSVSGSGKLAMCCLTRAMNWPGWDRVAKSATNASSVGAAPRETSSRKPVGQRLKSRDAATYRNCDRAKGSRNFQQHADHRIRQFSIEQVLEQLSSSGIIEQLYEVSIALLAQHSERQKRQNPSDADRRMTQHAT